MGDWDAMVTVGRIIRPQGIRGQVVVLPETDFGHERFAPGAIVYLERDGIVPLVVAEARPHGDRWVVGFDGVASIEEAETLRGAELRISAEALKALGRGAYYIHDLVGCEVTTVGGARVGAVQSVYTGAATPLLGIQSEHGEVLVPLVEGMCRHVDVTAKRIEIDPPDGLLEVNRPALRDGEK